MGLLCRWVLRLASFKFMVKHTWGADNVVADASSRVFEGTFCESPEITCAALIESLPLVYSSIEENQTGDSFCKDLRRITLAGQAGVDNFRIHKNLVFLSEEGQKAQVGRPCYPEAHAAQLFSRFAFGWAFGCT